MSGGRGDGVRNRKWTELTLRSYLDELGLSGVIARDELAQVDMMMEDIPGWSGGGPAPRPWIDEDAIALLMHLQQTTNTAKLTMLNSVLSSMSVDNAYSPLQKMFEALPKWDGKKRLDQFLPKALGLDMRDVDMALYHRKVSERFLWAIVSRVMDPGIKFDNMLILDGPQGIGKSRFCKAMAFGKDDWFTDSMPAITGTTAGNAREHLMGKMIVEMGELAQFKGSHLEALKSFVTTSSDTVRLPYARRSGTYRRSCVLVGTTNEHNYLTDPTGNRRFWPVTCTDIDLTYVEDTLEQAYAEALHLWRRSKEHGVMLELWLPDDVLMVARQEQEARRDRHPFEPEVIRFVNKLFAERKNIAEVTTSPKDCLTRHFNQLDGDIMRDMMLGTKSASMRIGNIMSQLGGRRSRKTAGVEYCFIRGEWGHFSE